MKRSEYLSFRIDPQTKLVLKELAEKKKWSTSQLLEEIVHEWLLQYELKAIQIQSPPQA